MNPSQQARIYLNDTRGIQESSTCRSFHTFNSGEFRDDHRLPLETLYVLSDDTLAGGVSLPLKAEENTRIVLLPVTGTVFCNGTQVNPGQLLVMDIQAGNDINISNPYTHKNQLINFMQFWFTIPEKSFVPSQTVIPFDAAALDLMNHITTANGQAVISIGKYMGRSEDVYKIQQPAYPVFVFVIEGVFEVEGRLLHARDGLSLKNFNTIEWEALSNNAIIAILEIPLFQQIK